MYKSLQIWIINKCLFITHSIQVDFDEIDALFHQLNKNGMTD